MTEPLYSTPIKQRDCNYACNTKKKRDYLKAFKCFSSGSNINKATVRMSLVDSLIIKPFAMKVKDMMMVQVIAVAESSKGG